MPSDDRTFRLLTQAQPGCAAPSLLPPPTLPTPPILVEGQPALSVPEVMLWGDRMARKVLELSLKPPSDHSSGSWTSEFLSLRLLKHGDVMPLCQLANMFYISMIGTPYLPLQNIQF